MTILYGARSCFLNEYSKNSGDSEPVKEDEPLRAYGEGVPMGLTVLLDAQIDDYAITSSSFYGFKVFFFKSCKLLEENLKSRTF